MLHFVSSTYMSSFIYAWSCCPNKNGVFSLVSAANILWCNHMSFKLNLFCPNVMYLVFNIFSSKLVFLGSHTASPVIAPLIEAFWEVRGLKLRRYIPWFCLNHVCIIKSILLNTNLSFGEREKSSGANWCGKTLKLLLKVLAHVTICLLLPEWVGHRFGRNLMHI